MELSSQALVPGVRFSPNEQELVKYYLYPKLTKPLFTTSAPVRDRDIYACQPLQIWNELHMILGEDGFFFTNLKMKSLDSNVKRKIASGPASWHREDCDKKFRVTIDNHSSVTATRKGFSYRSPDGCHWTMYEYSLQTLSKVTVLCRMRMIDGSKSHPQRTKKMRRSHADGVDDATNTTSQKARVGDHQGCDQQQITAPAGSTDQSGIVYNGVRFDNVESFLHNDDYQMHTSSKELDDYSLELLRVLRGPGGSDLADGLPSIQTTPEADANPSGSRK